MNTIENRCFEASQRVQESWLCDLLAEAGDEIVKLKNKLKAYEVTDE